jgi:protein gp37
VKAAPWWTFVFLSKFPERMAKKPWRNFPANAWVGATVDGPDRIKLTERAFAKINAKVKFVSCEPLCHEVEKLEFDKSFMKSIQWVIIGGQGEIGDVEEDYPRASVVESLVRQARDAGCAVYLKNNSGYRPQEYPLQEAESAANAGKPRKIRRAPVAPGLPLKAHRRKAGVGVAQSKTA